MSQPQDQPSGSPPDASSSHQAAASASVDHLKAAYELIARTYDHPHYADRVKMIGQHITSLIGVIDHMPGEEVSRADHAERVMKAYRNRELGTVIPQHDENALRWELERLDKAAS